MTIDAEDKRYSNSTTITNGSELDDGYFASVVTVQHSQKTGSSQAHDLELKKVTWPDEFNSSSVSQKREEREVIHHHRVVHPDDYHLQSSTSKNEEHQTSKDAVEEKPFGWIHQVANSGIHHHHLLNEAEMELQKRAFDVKHANDRSRSRSRSNFITERARSFERAHAVGSEGPPPPARRRRSPSLRRNDIDWICPQEGLGGLKNHHRVASVGRLDTSPWETRIRQGSPAPPPPTLEKHLRRRHLTGERTPPPPRSSSSMKDAKVNEWIRKSQDCLVNQSEHNQSHHREFESSSSTTHMTNQTESRSAQSEALHVRQEHLVQMEEEKRRQEMEIRRHEEELCRKEHEAKKKELEMLRKKEEMKRAEELARASAQKKQQFEEEKERRRRQMEYEARQKQMAEAREEIRIREECQRQRKYEEELKQKHMEEERRKEQKLLYEKRVQRDKEEQSRLQKLQLEQRQERLRKQEQEEAERLRQLQEQEAKRLQQLQKQKEEIERQRQFLEQEAERNRQIHKLEEQESRRQREAMKIQDDKRGSQEQESRRPRARHRSREGRFTPQDRKEIPRSITPVGVRTGHVNSKRHFFNERSKSVDRKEEYEPRRQRCHRLKDWARVQTTSSEDYDPPSRPGSSLGQSLGAVKSSIDNWNHNSLQYQSEMERPSSRARSLSQHRDWRPIAREGSCTPTRFDTVDTHQVHDTVKEWGSHQPHSGRNTPVVPSRMIAETFADSKVGSKEWNSNESHTIKETNMNEDVPWRTKASVPEPNLKVVNISVKRNILRDKPKEKSSEIPPLPRGEPVPEKCTQVPNRNLFITELPDLPLQHGKSTSKFESKQETRSSTTMSSSTSTFEESVARNKEAIPVPVVSDSWFTSTTTGHVISPTSSASTIAHLEGLKSPTQTGKTPLPVLAGWYDPTKTNKNPSRGSEVSNNNNNNNTKSNFTIPPAPPPPKASEPQQIQKYESDVDKRARELEELRSMRADRNKRLQDAFELGDPYLDTEESVVSYSDDYTDDEQEEDEARRAGVKKEEGEGTSSRPVPTRRIGNLFNRSSDIWKEDVGPCPPQRNSSKEFMKALKS